LLSVAGARRNTRYKRHSLTQGLRIGARAVDIKGEKMNISKELLSEVLGYKAEHLHLNTSLNPLGNDIVLRCDNKRGDGTTIKNINIYELAHKCKEWGHNKGFILKSWKLRYESMCSIEELTNEPPFITLHQIYNEDTEPEAIFKACEWIFNER